MQILIDVLDASGNRLGDGPVLSASSVSLTRTLDGSGTIAINCPASDERATELLQAERRIRVYVEDTGGLRIVGEGVIRQRKIRNTSGGATLSVDGPDIMDELKRRSVTLALIYNQQTVSTVASGLIALVPGWSVSVDAGIASDVVDARYDGVSVLKALQNLAMRYGYHLRLNDAGTRTVTIGAMGADNGLRLHGVGTVSQSLLNNNLVMPVESINFGEDSESICNWLLPIGAGEGIAALTLEKSTLSGTPYTINTQAGPDGTTLYYIEDSTSIAAYGQIEKVGQFKDIAPLSNSTVDTRNAADALYTAAVEHLTRYKDPQETYSVTVKSVKNNLLPGDKIHLEYKGQVYHTDGWFDYLDIRDDFWIMKVRESITGSGIGVTLDLSSVDRRQDTVEETVLSAIESIELKNLKPTISGSIRSYVYSRNIDSTHPAVVPIEITGATMEVQRVRLRIKTTPFEAVASAAASGGSSTQSSAAGGDHNHRVFVQTSVVGFPSTSNRAFWGRDGDGGSFIGAVLPTAFDSDIWTENSSGSHSHSVSIPAHTHTMTFGNLLTDSSTPSGITVSVNGADKTADLFPDDESGGVLAPSGGNQDVVADAGELTTLLENAAGGLRQEHEITIACTSGRGNIEATVEVFEVIQTINLS